jgi:Na+-driven multidrug efflux pump
MAPFLMNVASCFVVILINRQLQTHGGDMAIGAYGIINRIVFLFVMLIMGFTQGMQPIAGYNYGARHTDRLKHVFVLTLKICFIIGVVGSLVSCIFPATMVKIFTSDRALIRLGIPAMRFLMVMFPLIGFTIVNSTFFQSIDKPWIAIVTSLSRQMIFLLPLAFIMPIIFTNHDLNGLTGVWVACTISDVMGALLAAALLFSQRKIFTDPTPHEHDVRTEAGTEA